MRGPFSQAFFAGDARATRFLRRDFADPVARSAQASRAAKHRVSPQVLEALIAQNRQYPPSPAREKNLEALGHAGTTVMVTGQQVGLFLGPLYSFHKAAAAIADARAIERETGVRCVPVFWLQSEDHDFDEINECVVIGRDGQLVTFALDDGPPKTSRISVKHIELGPSVAVQVERLAEAVGPGPFLDAIRRHYRPGVGLVAAFAGLMAEVFADEGLILVDPREAALAKAFVPLHERAVADAATISLALQARSEALEAAGFEVQVHVRGGSPLSFFHPEGPTGPRARIDEQSIAVSAVSPLSWSSSALLRPILQDSILPTVGYVGGPGELNYFAQLPPLYEAFGVEMPMFVPRARFRLIDPRTKSRMLKRTEAAPSGSIAETEVQARLVTELNRVLDSVPSAPDIDDALKRTRGTIERAASRFAARYGRALRARDRVSAERTERIDAVLTPRGEPQERVLGLPSFACKSGLEAVKTAVFAALVPFDPEVKDVFL